MANGPTKRSASAESGPLLSKFEKSAGRGATAQIVFDPARDPFLIEHRLKNKPFLPAVVGIESLVEVAQAVGGRDAIDPRHVFELRNVKVVNGLAFPSDQPIAATVTATAIGGELACVLTTEVRDRQGRVIDPAKRLIEAIIPAGHSEPITAARPRSPPLGWYPYAYVRRCAVVPWAAAPLLERSGIRLRGWLGQNPRASIDELAGPRRTTAGCCRWPCSTLAKSPAAVSSICNSAAPIEVPFEFERLRWSRAPRPGENCLVQMRFRGRKDRNSLFDFTLYGDDKQPILDAEGYRTVLLGDGGDEHAVTDLLPLQKAGRTAQWPRGRRSVVVLGRTCHLGSHAVARAPGHVAGRANPG